MNFFIPQQSPISMQNGVVEPNWRKLFEQLASNLTSLQATVAAVPGVNRWVLADQPTLGLSDAGYVAFVSDYGHFVRWTGTAWEFAPGDPGNGFFSMRGVAPQEVGWQLCDGTATTYLVVGGATLTMAAFTTPNLTGTPAYLKTANAYTGTINAKAGSTANESAHTHSVTVANHTHTYNGNTDATAANLEGAAGAAGSFLYGSNHAHSYNGTTAADGGATVTSGAGSAHAHTVGTIEMANLGALPYFRR